MNVTVPVGVPDAEPATTAVNVMSWPDVAGLADALREVVVDSSAGALTVCVKVVEELPWNFPVGV